MKPKIILLILVLLFINPLVAQAQGTSADLNKLLAAELNGKSPLDDAELARRVAIADKSPLGTKENPIRVHMPAGERAYLDRLRCADGRAPLFNRNGDTGPGVFDSIVDLYTLDCGSAAPGKVEVLMDMYHPDYLENRPVPGFFIVGGGK